MQMKTLTEARAGLIALGVLIILAAMNYFGVLFFLNEPLSGLVAGQPDRSCNADSDCAFKEITCDSGGCGGAIKDAVNRKWNNFCPFGKPRLPYVFEAPCTEQEIKCVENRCVKVEK